MLHWLEKLSDARVRESLGRRFEAVTDEAFHVIRWAVVVGLARYLALESRDPALVWVYRLLALLLFGYLASRFLLQPEIPIFRATDRRWKRIVQTAANYLICMGAFMAAIWAIDAFVRMVADIRFGAPSL